MYHKSFFRLFDSHGDAIKNFFLKVIVKYHYSTEILGNKNLTTYCKIVTFDVGNEI